jgi:hypothetical protein
MVSFWVADYVVKANTQSSSIALGAIQSSVDRLHASFNTATTTYIDTLNSHTQTISARVDSLTDSILLMKNENSALVATLGIQGEQVASLRRDVEKISGSISEANATLDKINAKSPYQGKPSIIYDVNSPVFEYFQTYAGDPNCVEGPGATCLPLRSLQAFGLWKEYLSLQDSGMLTGEEILGLTAKQIVTAMGILQSEESDAEKRNKLKALANQ